MLKQCIVIFLRRLRFVFHLYLKGRGKVGFIFGIFRFFKMPLQMAIGLYLAFMMLIGTVAGIAFFAEGIDYCNELKFAVRADNPLPIFWELLMNEHLTDKVNRLASQITEQERRDLSAPLRLKRIF